MSAAIRTSRYLDSNWNDFVTSGTHIVSHFSYSLVRFHPGCVLSSRSFISLSAIAPRPLKTAEGSVLFYTPPKTRPQSLRVGITGDTPYRLGIDTHTWRVVSNVTWDRVPGPNTTWKEVWANTGDWGMHGELPARLNRVLGLVSPFSASLVRCVTSQIQRNR